MAQQWTFSKSPLLNLPIVVLIENYIMEGVRLPSSEILFKKLFKNDIKCFLFHLNGSFGSQYGFYFCSQFLL